MFDFAELWVSLNKFKPAWMGLPRLAAAFMVFPLFSGTIMTGMVRNGILLSLVIILYPLLDATYPKTELVWTTWLWLIVKEIFIGVVIAYMISMPFWIVESVGHLIDFQTGASNSMVFDPISGKESGINAQFLLQLTGAAFFASGGFLFMTGVMFESYKIWPVYSALPQVNDVFSNFFIRETAGMMQMIIKISAPIIMILIIVELGLGLVNRFAPQLNVFWLSQPIKGFVAVWMIALFLAYMLENLRLYLLPQTSVLETLHQVFN
jgi:type III secretion protein T